MARFVFNPPQAAVDDGNSNYVYASAPTVTLEEQDHPFGRRNAMQAQKIRERAGTIGWTGRSPEARIDDLDLDWAFRNYRVTIVDQRTTEMDRPPQPLAAPWAMLGAPGMAPNLYLFNVIVALEWLPSAATLNRLEWAFRRASDFLYDVTNGAMAFGQVVFADQAWMECADIQIMASNRFLPRSWVSGLLDPVKYTPIRVGRGLWVRERQAVVPWDEPEGYRALVHEWSHYALGLKDEYLSPVDVLKANDFLLKLPNAANNESTIKIVIPKRRIVSESIMATAEGNSELLPFTVDPSYIDVDGAKLDDFYPKLTDRRKQDLAGPHELPLPLPVFHYLGAINPKDAHGNERKVLLNLGDDVAVLRDGEGLVREGTALYLLRGGDPPRIVPQGELTATALRDDATFELLGAEVRDMAVLIGRDGPDATVWTSTYNGSDTLVFTRQAAQLDHATSLDVVPRGDSQQNFAVVAVQPDEAATGRFAETNDGMPDATVLFNLYGVQVPLQDYTAALPSLDGYVLTVKNGSLMVSDFSKGGPPNSAPNIVSDFVAAGAASGDAVLFFDEKDAKNLKKLPETEQVAETARLKEKYKDNQVVVTTLRGVKLPDGYTAISPVYSVASTGRLPADTSPTLLIVNPLRGPGEASSLRICRLDGPDIARVLPTFFSNGATFAATPLADPEAGASLIQPEVAVRVERYVLANVPPDELAKTAAAAEA